MIGWLKKIIKKIVGLSLSDRVPFADIPVMSRRAQYLSVKGVISKKYFS